ncbi:TRAP transporter substrate-binding protein [Desulfosporosinus burensis]
MKLSDVEPAVSPQHHAVEKFKEAVEKATNGNLKVELYPNSQLGDARTQIEATQLNTQQGFLLPTSNLTGFYSTASITDLPFLFPNREITYKVMDGDVGQEYLKGFEKVGLKGVDLWESGFKQFSGNFPINTPDDYKGKKIRVMENPVLIAQYQALGASAVPINFAETYNALQQGVVEGQENPMSSIFKMKFHEVQKTIAISDHGWLPLLIGINKNFWDSLPKEYQAAIVKGSNDSKIWLRQELARLEKEEYIPAFEKTCKVVKLTPQEKQAFADKVKDPARAKMLTLLDDQGKTVLNKIDAQIKELNGK